jgi:HEAT repeat protein
MISTRSTWILLALFPACASTEGTSGDALDGAKERMKITAYNPDAKLENITIGSALAQLDRWIQMWNNLFLSGSAATDAQRLQGLEDAIEHKTAKLYYQILAELESGPPYNRRVAAVAIGFVGSAESLSPLLNALSDPDDQVVANALLGLAVLGDSNTPTESLVHFMQFGATPAIRNNATLTTLEVLRKGGDGGEQVTAAARNALLDDDPGVRTQAALILAHELDVGAIDALALQLFEDPVPSAAMAASRALAYLGSKKVKYKGAVARVLTAALSRVSKPVRGSLLMDLRKLSSLNWAEDEDWVTWAHRLPPKPL